MIPKLRFPDFIGDWKTITFGELVEDGVILKPMDGNHGEIHPTSKDYVEEGVPFLMASDISNGQINFNDCKKISESTAKGLRKGFAQNNDVLLTHKGTVGETAVLETDLDFVMLTPQVTYYRVKDKSILESYFLHSAFQAPRFQKNLNIISGGGTRAYIGITKQLLLKMSIPAVSEQKRIASIFLQLDQKINLLTKKKEALETYKKGLMQKIFSQELRFKREDGTNYPEWRITSLGEVSEVIMGQSPSSSSYNELGQGLPLAQGKADFEDSVFNSVRYTSEPTKVIPAKTILMSVRAPVGFIGYADREVCIGRGMCAIKTAHMSYIHAYLTFYQTEWRKIQQGSTFEAVSGKDIKDVKVPMPTSELEERSITECFNLIDNKIKAISNLLNNTLSLKKGLLQQMFV